MADGQVRRRLRRSAASDSGLIRVTRTRLTPAVFAVSVVNEAATPRPGQARSRGRASFLDGPAADTVGVKRFDGRVGDLPARSLVVGVQSGRAAPVG
jgi:hypothetical protein